MNFTILLSILFASILLVKSENYENLVDGSYRKVDKIPNFAELYTKSERKLEYKFFDMTFDIYVDLPLDIDGLAPYLFCPEIIFTLFLRDDAQNLYQCDAYEVISNLTTLACQQLVGKADVTCIERHQKTKPIFLKQYPKTNNIDTASNDRLFYYLLILSQIIWSIVTFILICSLKQTRKQKYAFQHNRENSWLTERNQKDISLIQKKDIEKGKAEKKLRNLEISHVYYKNGELSTKNDMGEDDDGFEKFIKREIGNVQNEAIIGTKNYKNQESDKHTKDMEKLRKENKCFAEKMLRDENFEAMNMENEKIIRTVGIDLTIQLIKNQRDMKRRGRETEMHKVFNRETSNHLAKDPLKTFNSFNKVLNLVTIEKKNVTIFNTKSKTISTFPANVDYSCNPPKIGVNYVSPNVVTLNINGSHKTINKEFWDLSDNHTYNINIDNKAININIKMVVADILQKVKEFIDQSHYVIFKIRPSIDEVTKNEYLKTIDRKNLDNVKLVDEQILIAKSITTEKNFILLNFCNDSLVISLFQNYREEVRKVARDVNKFLDMEPFFPLTTLIGLSHTVRKIKYDTLIATIDMLHQKTNANLIFITRNSYIYDMFVTHYSGSSLILKFIKDPEKIVANDEDIYSSTFDSAASRSETNAMQKEIKMLIDKTTRPSLFWENLQFF